MPFVKDDPNINRLGRPKGSFSIKDAIRQRLQDNPEEFEELIGFYLKDRKMRDLLWRMIDGNPMQSTDITSGGKPLILPSEIINKNEDKL